MSIHEQLPPQAKVGTEGSGLDEGVRAAVPGTHRTTSGSPASSTAPPVPRTNLPSSTNLVSRSASLACSHARISSIFVSTNKARFLFSFGLLPRTGT
jgi:hypothetical protein